jgi:hypothetical protein
MTPQAILRARFSELAESLDVRFSARRQGDKFYFNVLGEFKAVDQFMRRSFAGAWMTSAGGDVTYGLPLADVERVLSGLQVEPSWLQGNDAAARRIAQQIRDEGAFDHLPILADALEEAGCDHADILGHCRASVPHQQTCWVVELLLGPGRKRRAGPDASGQS